MSLNRRIPGLVFWGWNFVFLLLIGLILFTGILPPIFIALVNGAIPLSFALSILLIIAVPIGAVVLALRRKNRDSAFLLRLFFGVETPLFLAALIRVFVMRELNWGSTLLLLSILAACSYFLWTLYGDKFKIRNALPAVLHAAPSTIMLVFGVGAALFLALYAPPVAAMVLKAFWHLLGEFFSFEWVQYIGEIFSGGLFGAIFLVFFLLLFISSLVFIVAPFFMAFYYSETWRRVMGMATPHVGKAVFIVLSLVIGGAWISAYALSGRQPAAQTITWLDEQENLADMREEISARREDIRRDLVNAYLYRYRYLQTRKDTNGIARLYIRNLGFPSPAADAVQSLNRLILSPLLYSGARDDDKIAARLYHQIFDEEIQKAERTDIKKALQATWNRDEAEAGLLDIDAKKVFLAEQHIIIEEFEHHAAVEIEEIYENRTGQQQEIYYYFALPEDAAITGLWLGFGADRSKHDKFVVAPRGAAQEVYEAEVQRRVDPALLEQVGPRQYRLRAFPVPPKEMEIRGRRAIETPIEESRPLRMRFTYDVPKTGAAIELPTLLEKRNVFWSKKTKRTLNSVTAKETNWMPAFEIAKTQATPLGDVSAVLPEGYSVSRTAFSRDDAPMKLAVIMDTSWSMHRHGEALEKALAALNQDPAVTAELFVIGANGAASFEARLSSYDTDQSLSFFGALSPQQMLTQFERRNQSGDFDAVLVLTDQADYRGDDAFDGAAIDAPLWFVHFGLPAFAYDDGVLDLIYRTGGGVALNVDDALNGISASAMGLRIAGEQAWKVEPLSAGETEGEIVLSSATPSPLAAIAARQVALSMTQDAKTDLALLDEIHALAVAHDIVTPWSSMIVLVNERQRQALEEASKNADRFDREANTGEETLTAPSVTGVPEPHEWMLILAAGLMLMVLWRRRSVLRLN